MFDGSPSRVNDVALLESSFSRHTNPGDASAMAFTMSSALAKSAVSG
jgi:hypothetical protein